MPGRTLTLTSQLAGDTAATVVDYPLSERLFMYRYESRNSSAISGHYPWAGRTILPASSPIGPAYGSRLYDGELPRAKKTKMAQKVGFARV